MHDIHKGLPVIILQLFKLSIFPLDVDNRLRVLLPGVLDCFVHSLTELLRNSGRELPSVFPAVFINKDVQHFIKVGVL